MKHLAHIFLFLVIAGLSVISARAQDPATGVPADTKIPRNSRIYISPMDGFENYLAAALRKKEVPLVIVAEPDLADFIVTGTHDKKSAGWAKTIFMGDTRGSASASMQVVNVRTHVIV